jgi:hypothetical protein
MIKQHHGTTLVNHFYTRARVQEDPRAYAVQKSFTTILLGIFHHRIEYPERMENGGFDKRFPRLVHSGQATGAKSNRRLVNLFGLRE